MQPGRESSIDQARNRGGLLATLLAGPPAALPGRCRGIGLPGRCRWRGIGHMINGGGAGMILLLPVAVMLATVVLAELEVTSAAQPQQRTAGGSSSYPPPGHHRHHHHEEPSSSHHLPPAGTAGNGDGGNDAGGDGGDGDYYTTYNGAEVDVEQFGAKADGKTECSAAFTAALRNVSTRGGGIVHARGQGVYVVNPILLQNHTVLQISAGAESTKAYPPCGTVLFAANVHNFSVRGGGSIDGGGVAFDNPPYTHPRGPLLQFWMSSHAIVEDLQFYNSANVHVAPVFSRHMHFRRLYMYSDFAGSHHKNTDGFNPSSSCDISLTDSYIHNGDDCIAVKSGKQPAAWSCDVPSENILVKNVTCAGSHGLTIGSEVAGGIRNVTFSDVRIHGADGHPSSGAIKFKLPCGRGAYVQDVLYENIAASDVASGIMLAGAGTSCSINGTTVVSNVTIRNVRAEKIAGPAFAIDGYSVEGRPASYTPFSVRLENVTITQYAQLGSCTHATVQALDVSPAVPTKDTSCVISKQNLKSDDDDDGPTPAVR